LWAEIEGVVWVFAFAVLFWSVFFGGGCWCLSDLFACAALGVFAFGVGLFLFWLLWPFLVLLVVY
jgi:hypothetical protein